MTPEQVEADMKVSNSQSRTKVLPKIKQEITNDLLFYEKVKDHHEREKLGVLKNKHLFLSSSSSSSDDEGNPMKGRYISDVEEEEIYQIDETVTDLSITENELLEQAKLN